MKAILFFLVGCVDVPLPIDGQIYHCEVLDKNDGHVVFEQYQCGAWDDWRTAADVVHAHWMNFNVSCFGTRAACDYGDPGAQAEDAP